VIKQYLLFFGNLDKNCAEISSDEDPDDIYVDENNVLYRVEKGRAINLAVVNDSRSESMTRNLSSSSSSSSSSSTFTELQPASIYTQLPSIDTLSGVGGHQQQHQQKDTIPQNIVASSSTMTNNGLYNVIYNEWK
jgi:hypothetical protein